MKTERLRVKDGKVLNAGGEWDHARREQYFDLGSMVSSVEMFDPVIEPTPENIVEAKDLATILRTRNRDLYRLIEKQVPPVSKLYKEAIKAFKLRGRVTYEPCPEKNRGSERGSRGEDR